MPPRLLTKTLLLAGLTLLVGCGPILVDSQTKRARAGQPHDLSRRPRQPDLLRRGRRARDRQRDRGAAQARVLPAVAFDCSALRVIRGSGVRRRVPHVSVVPKKEVLEGEGASEFSLKLPFAWRLIGGRVQADLRRGEALHLTPSIISVSDAKQASFSKSEIGSNCEAATHITHGASFGAYPQALHVMAREAPAHRR